MENSVPLLGGGLKQHCPSSFCAGVGPFFLPAFWSTMPGTHLFDNLSRAIQETYSVCSKAGVMFLHDRLTPEATEAGTSDPIPKIAFFHLESRPKNIWLMVQSLPQQRHAASSGPLFRERRVYVGENLLHFP